jgi:tetratricopeptide (TPR) repeat protein
MEESESVIDNIKEGECVIEEIFTPGASANSLEEALITKEEGNQFYKEKKYDEASCCYSRAISLCPDIESNKDHLSVFFGNRAACYFAMEEYELVVEDCSFSLERKPNHPKILMRRSQAYEKLDKLDEALADAKLVFEIDPSYPKISTIVEKLGKQCDEKLNKMKDEALGK